MKSYKFLEQIFCKINNLDVILEGLHCKKYNAEKIPNIDALINQITTIEEIKHEIISDSLIDDMIDKTLINKNDLSELEFLNLQGMQKTSLHNKIPLNIKLELSRAKIKHGIQWLIARKNNDRKLAMSSLSEVVKLVSEIAAITSDVLNISKYDTLLHLYNTNITSKDLDVIFSDLGVFFRNFYNESMNSQQKNGIYKIIANKNKQPLLDEVFLDCLKINKNMLYFETNANNHYIKYINDPYQIFRNYDQENYVSNSMKLFNNLGKILYREKTSPTLQLVNKLPYEATGILMSNCILSSQEFMQFLYPHFKKIFALRGKANSYENLLAIFTEITPDPLFEKSDEVSAIGHIMLRYILEKEIINDHSKIKELPDSWTNGMEFYYNIKPNNDQEGFMQDDFWINGVFGYLPCITISSIIAAEMFNTIQTNQQEILADIKKGDFKTFLLWFSDNCYKSRFTESIPSQKPENKDLNISIYKKYLVEKYFNH